ncbi:MAG: DUF1284 domain-containing protein [Defluviitaleaceae bacterium]|nr:DUF1284 domain-containing protein [Defluviitaleaceae bacterium]
MRLRPHHLLCIQGYEGKGYSEEFVKNMDDVVQLLSKDRDAMVDIVFSTDDICCKCPLMLGCDLCQTNDKVKAMDSKVIEYFGLKEKSYMYHKLIDGIKEKMTAEMMDDICGDCSWYASSNCKKNMLGLGG